MAGRPAGGLNGCTYPYGSDFDLLAGNAFESRLKHTTPVGIFPAGQSPEQVYDLSGNVNEWTTSLWGEQIEEAQYSLPYDSEDGRENCLGSLSVLRVVRGGSWSNSDRLARAAFRFRLAPSDRRDVIGFRLIVRPPSQSSL